MPLISLTTRRAMWSSTSGGKPVPVRGHEVVGGHRADRQHLLVGPLVAHHPDRPHRQQHAQRLGDLVVQPGPPNLLDDDGVGLLQGRDPLAVHRAEDPHRQARARERVAPDELVRQAELLAEPPDLVLEQVAQRLHQLEAEPLGQAADVVVGLDHRRRAAHPGRLDDVRVERPLGQIAGVGKPSRLGLEDLDELAADDPAFLLRVGDSRPARRGTARDASTWSSSDAEVREPRDHLVRPRPCAADRCRRRSAPAGRRSPRAAAPR